MKKIILALPLALLVLLLTGCSSGGGGSDDNTISGVVRLPAQQVALRPPATLLGRIAEFILPSLHADVTGLVPVPNVTVELVRIDNAGNITAVIASTTSDASGNYTFTTSEPPASDLAVHLPGEATPTRALVSGTSIDITPVSEAVVRSILDEIAASATALGNYTTSEVAALVDLVNGMDIDVSTAPTFNDAVNIVRSESGSLLTNMVKGYSSAGASSILARKNYNVVGESTTLVPPPQLNGTSAAIDHRTFDGAFGFKSTGEVAPSNFGQISIVLSDLATASFFCDIGSAFGASFTAASNGQLTIIAADGSGAVAGAVSTDGAFMVYPTSSVTAAIDGLGSGFGGGLQVAMRQGTTIPTSGADLNPLLKGDYNFIWSATHMTPEDPLIPSTLSLTALTGTATLSYDGGITLPDVEGRNSFVSASTVIEALKVDIASGTVSSSTNTVDTVNGVYEVLPQNKIVAQLGDPATLLGGGGGSADFMQGLHLDPPAGATNPIAPLAAFSVYVTAGQMAGGGGLGLGNANCSSGSGNTSGGGGLQMGASNGEGRGLALAAPKTPGLAAANISGVYNVAAQLTTITQGTGTAIIDSEIDYGTFTFDGLGAITSGTLRFKRSSLNTADAINGLTTAVTTSSGTTTYTGSYSVNAVDGTLTFTLTGGITTGTGFVANNGDFLALPILSNGTGTGSRGLLLLMRQP